MSEVSSGRTLPSSATLSELIEAWLSNVGESLSPSTLHGYQRVVANYVGPSIGKVRIAVLTAAHLDRMYQAMLKKGLAPATIRQAHAVASSALNQGVKWGWLGDNVALKATPPPVRRKPLKPPSPDDVIRLIEAAKASRFPELGTFIHLAAVTGARRGELVAVRWYNVDLVLGELLIEHSMLQQGSTVREKDTKTHQARRIALDAGTVDLLAVHRERMEQRIAGCGVAITDDAFVFSDEPDCCQSWKPDRITLAFRRFCVQEDITGVRFHDLRHFAATRLLSGGVDVRTVSGRLGHSNAATTLGVYSHFLESADRAAADLLGGLMNRPSVAPK